MEAEKPPLAPPKSEYERLHENCKAVQELQRAMRRRTFFISAMFAIPAVSASRVIGQFAQQKRVARGTELCLQGLLAGLYLVLSRACSHDINAELKGRLHKPLEALREHWRTNATLDTVELLKSYGLKPSAFDDSCDVERMISRRSYFRVVVEALEAGASVFIGKWH
jgi:hypothetical protein